MKKDTLDAGNDTDVEYDSRAFLNKAYLHPAVDRAMAAESDEEKASWIKQNSNAEGPKLVALTRYTTSAKHQAGRDSDKDSAHVSRASSISRRSATTPGEITPTRPLLSGEQSTPAPGKGP